MAVLAEAGTGDAASVLGDARVVEALGGAGRKEIAAIEGLGFEAAGKRDAARTAWQAYRLSAGRGVWAANAQAHEASASGAKRP